MAAADPCAGKILLHVEVLVVESQAEVAVWIEIQHRRCMAATTIGQRAASIETASDITLYTPMNCHTCQW